MTPATTFAGRRVALFGLGGSGLATARALKAGGAEVVACDDNAARMEAAAREGIGTGDLRGANWSGFAALVLSPGVPLTHPEPHWTVPLARAAGVEIIGDIELFCRERAKVAPGAPFVAITGTNGKSTTTALVAHLLREAGQDVQMGGNIGTAVLSLDPPAPDRVHVIEMSSFQIDLTPSFGSARSSVPRAEVLAVGEPRSTQARGASVEADLRPAPQDEDRGSVPSHVRGPSVGVLLNITPDHLDRHGTMANYAAIKERVVASSEYAVVGVDDEFSTKIATRLLGSDRRAAIRISLTPAGDLFALPDGAVSIRQGGRPLRLASTSHVPTLRGHHNDQNALAAIAATLQVLDRWSDIDKDNQEATLENLGWLQRALDTFPGLHHRMEEVARRGRAIFVNDSKATNADSTEKALSSFDHVFWIAGGKPKEGGIAPLKALFTKVEKAYLIGEAAEEFAATLDGVVPVARSGTLDRAVAEAAADAARSAAKEPVVLLSPACASYDQYPNFEVRGDHFRELVRALPGVTMRT